MSKYSRTMQRCNPKSEKYVVASKMVTKIKLENLKTSLVSFAVNEQLYR